MKLPNPLIGRIVSTVTMALFAGGALAGAHGGAKVSNVDELPERNGDWSDAEVAKGREQLIRAFDAGWIRVIASRKDLEILETEPVNQPGAAKNYMVRLADCLPQPEIAEWPEKPVGLFKDILETGVIRQLVQGVPQTPENTSWYFSGISQRYQDAVFAEIEKHYDVKLTVENVVMPPGRLPITSLLNSNKVDFITQLNATGGNSQGLRRRVSRRFSCTMSASAQFIHIPEKSKLVAEIKSFNDLMARPDVSICAGPLTTQAAQAYLPEHTVKTKFVNDLSACDAAVKKGDFDIIINPLHDLSVANLKGYTAVPTLLIAGTPLWVAAEGIECPSDGDPKTEDECFEMETL
jgi:hypothetical protein